MIQSNSNTLLILIAENGCLLRCQSHRLPATKVVTVLLNGPIIGNWTSVHCAGVHNSSQTGFENAGGDEMVVI